MKVVTVATSSRGLFPYYKAACDELGFDLVVLGWGEKWHGFSWRWDLLEGYLKTLPKNEVVVWTDAYDVLPVAGPQAIASRFLEFRADIVLSTEVPTTLWRNMWRKLIFGSCKNSIQLNGGLYMGYCGALLDMIALIKSGGIKPDDDDQRLMNVRLCTNPFIDRCAFDHDSRIFYNMNDCGDVLPDTCFIHGKGNIDMTMVLRKYGYDVSDPSSHRRDLVRYWIDALSHYSKTHKTALVFICLSCVCLIVLIKRGVLRARN